MYGKYCHRKHNIKDLINIQTIFLNTGLSHLHSLSPPVVHNNFKTSNVLVDENFIAKVADAGIIRLIQGSDIAGPSNRLSGNIYHDPEYGNFFSKTFPTSFTSYLLSLHLGLHIKN